MRSHRHSMLTQVHQQMAADAGAAVSVAGASIAWLTTANEVVQLFAGCIAIVAGFGAAWWHFERIRELRRGRKKD
jgi:hypothetical protein